MKDNQLGHILRMNFLPKHFSAGKI